jgi:hypothetical protein
VVAVAAEDSVPGDPLYLIKRVIEPVRELFEEDVAAVNRVEELETLLDRRATPQVIDRQVREAEEAVAPTERADLRRRLDEAIDRRPAADTISSPSTTMPASDPATRPDSFPHPSATTIPNPPQERPPADPDRTTAPPGDRRG